MKMKELWIGVYLLTSVTIIQCLPMLNCGYNSYQIKGESTCKQCPICPKGFGMDKKCSRYFQYPPQEVPQCIPCVDGISFSPYESSSVCDLCSEMDLNEREVVKCTRFHNRISVCKHGYFEDGAHGRCDQQCCFCDHNNEHVIHVQKCIDDNMPNGMFCAPSSYDGRCSVINANSTIV